MKKKLIFISSAAALTASSVILFREFEKKVVSRIYHKGKEDGIKEHMFVTKSFPPHPKVITDTLDKFDKFRTDTLQWLEDMLLYNKIELQSIPRDIRTSSENIYIMAFRISRYSCCPCERFVNDLKTLCEDICCLPDGSEKDRLLDELSKELHLNEHKEDECFVNFEKNLDEKILWELRRHSEASGKNLEQQLKNRDVN